MTAKTTTQTLAADFDAKDGAARAATCVIAVFGFSIVNTAVVHVKADGTPPFIGTKDWGKGRGALVGGTIGLIGGSLGVLAGGGIDALAGKVRDMGFKDPQLKKLGRSLGKNDSAVLLEIDTDAILERCPRGRS